jgi:hypothetical protein
VVGSVPSSDLTLALSLSALDELARPKAALEDAHDWAQHVGIVSSEASFVERRRVREAEYPQDFCSGPRSIGEALTRVHDHFETERYVFVGVSESDERAASDSGWAYRSVTDAATAADWRLAAAVAREHDWLQRNKDDSG